MCYIRLLAHAGLLLSLKIWCLTPDLDTHTHTLTLTNEVIGLAHVVVPDRDIQGLLGQLAVLYLIRKFLKRQRNVKPKFSKRI